MITFSIIGLGNRGSVYADGLMKQKDVKITAVCDICPESLKKAKDVYCVPEGNLFLSDDTFFEKKRADILIVSTMDEYHKDHANSGTISFWKNPLLLRWKNVLPFWKRAKSTVGI